MNKRVFATILSLSPSLSLYLFRVEMNNNSFENKSLLSLFMQLSKLKKLSCWKNKPVVVVVVVVTYLPVSVREFHLK